MEKAEAMEKIEFECCDCLFFKDGVCDRYGLDRQTTWDSAICTDFEYVHIKID